MASEDGCDFGYGFKELVGADAQFPTTERFNIFDGQIIATREFIGPYEDRINFITDHVLGGTVNAGDVSVYLSPAKLPGFSNVFASQIEIEGRGTAIHDGDTGRAKWDRAYIKVTYEARNFNANSEGGNNDSVNSFIEHLFIEETTETSAEFLKLPGSSVEMKRGGVWERLADDGDHHLVIPISEMKLKQHHIIRPNWPEIDDLIGKVNSEVFITPSMRWFKKETVMYNGVTGVTKINIFNGGGLGIDDETFTAIPLWTLEHSFSFNRIGWNKKIDSDGAVKDIRIAGGKRPLYELGDLNLLFFAEPPTELIKQITDLLVLIQAFTDAIDTLRIEIANIEVDGITAEEQLDYNTRKNQLSYNITQRGLLYVRLRGLLRANGWL